MSDLISRQAAIDAVEIGAFSAATIYGRTDEGRTALHETVRAIKALPPAQKTGKWEWDENAVDWGIGAWICSECKNDPQTYWSTDNANDPYEWGSSQYCPNCGAKMQRGEQECTREK